ncbi:AraC family transcriptional regulator [Pedobacter sp. Du54]|uniref:helix-turn-helix domain-containing protein n=1 Tax=Pedobacter anseongensis TaxID=3133439 RepID=UPI0030A0EAA0
MKLYIKNMVCNRCKMVVQKELDKLGLHSISVQLGMVEISEERMDVFKQLELLNTLQGFGFELLVDKKKQLVEQIKTAIIELVHYATTALNVNLSSYLSEKLNLGYANLSSTFSEMEGVTIERYFILQKIEKVKELLTYGEKSLSEIAYLLDYSSVAHLSAQFKKISGETTSSYKLAHHQERKTIDEV